MYRKRAIETILRIKELLYEQGFTIKGARRKLQQLARGEADEDLSTGYRLQRVRAELEEIAELLA